MPPIIRPRVQNPYQQVSQVLKTLFSSSAASRTSKMPETYNPADWDIFEESPSGLELTFTNKKTGYCTFYTPPGMTAKEILAIPAAHKYWNSEKMVEKYIKDKAAEKESCGGKDYENM